MSTYLETELRKATDAFVRQIADIIREAFARNLAPRGQRIPEGHYTVMPGVGITRFEDGKGGSLDIKPSAKVSLKRKGQAKKRR